MKKLITALSFAIAAIFATTPPSLAQALGTELEEANVSVARIEAIISHGHELLKEAKNDSDLPRVDCINSLLVNARGFLNVAQTGLNNLRDGDQNLNAQAKAHHLKLVKMSASKAEAIESKMLQCSPGVLDYSGETQRDSKRECSIQPCLSGEEIVDPENPNIISPSVDASPYR